MILFNITMQVMWPAHDAWKTWLTEKHLPAIVGTGFFSHYQLVRLLEVDETDGPTYAVQLYAKNIHVFNAFRELHWKNFSENERKTWGETAFSFGSVMEVIN